MNATTKVMMGSTVLLLVLALFLALKNHSELTRANAYNEQLQVELAKAQGGPLSIEEGKRVRASLAVIEESEDKVSLLKEELAKKNTELMAARKESEVIKAVADVPDSELTEEQRKIRNLQEIGEVIEASSEWNVVRINAGRKQNLDSGLTLAVRRGHFIIGDLKIDTVEENSAIGSMITKTMRPGVTVRLGDSVLPYPLY